LVEASGVNEVRAFTATFEREIAEFQRLTRNQ
jgi:hypothetical protein